MSITPLVSAIIPVYNGGKYLSETLDTVLSQRYPYLEVIAVDDGSSDGSRDILEEFKCSASCPFTLICTENRGVSSARNTGAESAQGEYLAFIDQDDLWLPEKTDLQVEKMQISPDASLCYTNFSVIAGDGGMVKNSAYSKTCLPEGEIFEDLIFSPFIAISSVMVSKESFWGVGGFNTGYHLCEDLDLLLRVLEGGSASVIREPLVRYRDHTQSSTYQKTGELISEIGSIMQYWKKRRPDVFSSHPLRRVKFRAGLEALRVSAYLKKNIS